MKSMRVIVADDEARTREFLEGALVRLGHEVLETVESGEALILACRHHEPDLVLTDIRMRGRDGIDAAAAVYAERPVPIVLISAFHERELIERATREHVLAYLVKPVSLSDLEPAIAVAMGRFEEFETLRREADSAHRALEERKIVERAKGIVMQRTGLGEAEAFRRLRQRASNDRVKLVEIARAIVAAEETMTLDGVDR